MFNEMFGFDPIDMLNTLEDRKIAQDKNTDCIIDTCAIPDSSKPYETAISHRYFNNCEWIVVELYDTKEDAIIGHVKWVQSFKDGLPESLQDVSDCRVVKLAKIYGCDLNKEHIKNT